LLLLSGLPCGALLSSLPAVTPATSQSKEELSHAAYQTWHEFASGSDIFWLYNDREKALVYSQDYPFMQCNLHFFIAGALWLQYR
jgi:hypothetical protein